MATSASCSPGWPPSASGRWRPGSPPGRRCSSPGASCRARAPRSCCPARWRSSRAPTRTRRSVRESREPAARAPDLTGAALAAAGLATATFAIIAGSPAAGVASAALLAALVAVERRSPDPMLPAALFRRPAFGAANAIAAAMNLGTLGTLFVLTLFLQDVQGRSALHAGVTLLPAFGLLTVVAPLSGRLVGRIGPRRPMVAGLLVAAAGLALLADDALLAA